MEVETWITFEAEWIYSKKKLLQSKITELSIDIKDKKGVLEGVVEYLNDLYQIFPSLRKPKNI